MNPNTRSLHALGQSLWLDNISRCLLQSGDLARYMGELSVSGRTSNPTRFEQAIEHDDAYDPFIWELTAQGLSAEDIALAKQVKELDGAGRHRMRIAFKNLRYALEFFTPLLSEKRLKHFLRELSLLQSTLGELNDLAVEQALVSTYRESNLTDWLRFGWRPAMNACCITRLKYWTGSSTSNHPIYAKCVSVQIISLRHQTLHSPKQNGR
jgi:hypothetical protein